MNSTIEEEHSGGGTGGMGLPRILISPSSPDQNQQLYTTVSPPIPRVIRQEEPLPLPQPAPSNVPSPRLPGSLSLTDSPSSPPPPPVADRATRGGAGTRTPSQSQSFFASLATNSIDSISNGLSSLMSIPNKLSNVANMGGGVKLIKISSGNGSNEKQERRSQREEEEESRSGESESETETESGSESEEEVFEVGSPMTDSVGEGNGGGEVGRQSMDLRLEEATTGPSSVLDTHSPSLVSPPLPSTSTSTTKPPKLHRAPSIAFKQASKESTVHPLTLQAIRRQDSEREALRLVEEMGEKGKSTSRNFIQQGEGDGGVLGRVRSESPTEMDFPELQGVGKGAVERGREDSQSTIKDQPTSSGSTKTPRSVSMIGNGLPSNLSTASRLGGGGGGNDRSVSMTSTKSKRSFFSRFKKEKKGSLSTSGSTSTSSMGFGGGVDPSKSGMERGGNGLMRSSSMMSGKKSRKGREYQRDREYEGTPPPVSAASSSGFTMNEAGGGGGTGKVRHPKVRTKGKSRKDFNKLFLAQELHLLSPSSPAEPDLTETSSIHTSTDDHSVHAGYVEGDRPPLTTNPSTTTSGSTGAKERNGKQSRAVWAVKWSNNGKWLAVGGRDGIVRVWEVLLTREERESIERTVAAGTGGSGAGGGMPIFKEKPIREYKGHGSDVLDLNWSKNDFLLSSSMDKTVRLWHIDRDECLCSFEHLDFVTSIAFHPKDDRFFLSGSLDCKLRLWNIVEKRVQVWTELPELITAVAFTRDGQYAIAGSFVGQCMFFEVETFRFHNVFTAKSSKRKDQKGKKITSLVTFPLGTARNDPDDFNTDDDDEDGTRRREMMEEECDRLLVTSNDSHMRLYNTKGKYVEAKYSGHENTSSQIRASFSDDGKYVISGSEDRHVYIWDSGIERTEHGDFEIVKKRTEGTGFESFSMSAHIVTAAVFAPTTTRSHLAKSGDPIFSNGENYPGLDPMPYSNTRSSAGAMSEKSERDRKGGGGKAAEDMIIVVADAETGTILVFRNSSIPLPPPSATSSIFRHNNQSSHGHGHQQFASSSSSMRGGDGTTREKRWSRASSTAGSQH